MIRSLLLFAVLLLCCTPADAQQLKANQPEQLNKPHVVLISMDGFRWDYVERFKPPHLSALIAEGVSAEAMIPCYPSKTFPNHYSIATGMRPMQHRLVGNSFFDAEKQKVYAISKREIVQDGSWYSGTPLWVNAEKQGMVTASYFFVGSEADIQGVRPTYYYNYDGTVPNARRIEQMLKWLHLPKENRPHLILGYFSDMDDEGHRYGPNDDENIQKALFKLDAELGVLFDGIRALDFPVNIILVSDHGMAEVKIDQLLPIEPLESEEEYRLISQGALIQLYLKEGVDIDAVCNRLRSLEWAEHFSVCKATEYPYYLGPRLDPRVGDVVILPDYPYYFVYARTMNFLKSTGRQVMGEHGFPTAYRDMYGIFYGWGPAFQQGAKVAPFENIHVYPLVCKLLELPVPPVVEGSLEVLKPLLKK